MKSCTDCKFSERLTTPANNRFALLCFHPTQQDKISPELGVVTCQSMRNNKIGLCLQAGVLFEAKHG